MKINTFLLIEATANIANNMQTMKSYTFQKKQQQQYSLYIYEQAKHVKEYVKERMLQNKRQLG